MKRYVHGARDVMVLTAAIAALVMLVLLAYGIPHLDPATLLGAFH